MKVYIGGLTTHFMRELPPEAGHRSFWWRLCYLSGASWILLLRPVALYLCIQYR